MADDAADGHPGVTERVERFVWLEDRSRPRWQRGAASVLQMIWAIARDLAEGQITLRAMSLVYTTLLSLVPLIAISFSILKGFGVHNQIEPLLLNALEPLGERRDEIAANILNFVDNVQVGVLGSVGFILLFYTVVSLMQKIELAFNDMWQISGTRTFAERFKDYLSVIIVGPVLVFASLGITATVMSDPLMERVTAIQPLGTILEFVGRLVPIFMVVLAFTFIYMFVPHTRVRIGPALTGGLVAGVLWNALGWLFAGFVAQANRYTAIYSGFATPILFMIWLYVGWLILLVGATIAFYRQHPEYLSGRQLNRHFSHADFERLALRAVRFIGERFYHGGPAPDADVIADALQVPANAIEYAVEPLERRGLVASNDQLPPGYLPGCPWESASVHDVLEATLDASRIIGLRRIATSDDGAIQEILDRRRTLSRETFGAISLKALATESEPGATGHTDPG
ncbi:MAG: YihY/virulence factor BrkB family protein [Pseudomonadales bacterium]